MVFLRDGLLKRLQVNKIDMATLYIGNTMVGNLVGGFSYAVVSSLPSASASTMGIIHLVPNSGSSDMYLTVESNGSYSWQQIGTASAQIEAITTSEIDALFD